MVIGLVVLAVAGTRVIDTRGEVGIDNFSLAPLSKIFRYENAFSDTPPNNGRRNRGMFVRGTKAEGAIWEIYWPEPTYYRNISLRSAASLQLQNDKKSTNGSHSRHFT